MIGGVIEWWTTLTPVIQFFWTVAICATVLQALMLLGVMVCVNRRNHGGR